MPRELADALFRPLVHTRFDLIAQGMSGHQITTAVRRGQLIRLRRDRYARPGLPEPIADAVRVGGRLTCVTLLQLLGVFVLEATGLHLQVARNGSRLGRPLTGDCRVHWAAESEPSFLHATSLRAAVRHAVRCQHPRAALASLDSLVHHRLLSIPQLTALFDELPRRYQPLLKLIDGSSESGPETFVRLMLRTLDVPFETQVLIPGVGRVDFLVDGWLIIECDSREFHQGWQKQREDRWRDLAAARLGYVTVRPLAADILHDGSAVRETLREIIEVLGARVSPAFQLRKNVRRRARTGTQPR